jgi:benzodiazapine receptor
MKIKSYPRLLAFLIIPLLAGAVGSYFTTAAIDTWYANLIKPALNPPDWLFAPVWTALYIFMGLAAYLVWEKKKEKGKLVSESLFVFFSQLALNSLWSIIFFGLKNPALALLEIIILWTLILIAFINFYKIRKWAGWLLIPYLAWTTFATYLNFMIVKLN